MESLRQSPSHAGYSHGPGDVFENPNGWLGALSSKEREAIKEIAEKPREIAGKTDFLAEGENDGRLHILTEGWAVRYLTGANGWRQIVAVNLPGDILDAERLYLDRTRFGLATITDCTVLQLDRQQLRELAQNSPAVCRAFGAAVAIERCGAGESAARLGQRCARNRMAHFFCEMAARLDKITAATWRGHHFPITQEQLGCILGMSVVHVNRTLQDLRADGLIEVRAQRMQILDREKLEQIAEFDDSYLHLEPVRPRSRTDDSEANVATIVSDDNLREVASEELRHRYKNLLAVVQSLVRQTLRDDVEISTSRKVLQGRLEAMRRSVEALTPGSWHRGSLADTIRRAMEITEGSDRISCHGPDLQLGGKSLMTLALALHELQTNAMKHGALSNDGGSVRLFWKIVESDEGQRLWMQWTESDGPEVRKPERTGFGARLLSSAAARSLSGEAVLDYTPEGLTWLLIAPLKTLSKD
ncbi:HWE histidine kinase domain-containing protein [Qipengyuania sp. JC766]|uniref:HWE histidine kinase domain-containing protein n=1 Tax=Qipengyuania sp. JC766 TaxID=3232139 RepID=UPI00345B3EB2